MFRKLFFYIMFVSFLFTGCDYFTQMNYKEWCEKNDRTPAFVFSNGAIKTTSTLTNTITIVAVEGNWIDFTEYCSPAVLQGRNVYLSSFFIGRYELRYCEWYEVYQWAISNGYTFQNYGTEGGDAIGTAAAASSSVAPTSRMNEPVTYINWHDAIVWCNALSEKEGLTPCYTYGGNIIRNSASSNATACDNAVLTLTNNGYRLPTEGEWEYAAMGGVITRGYKYAGSNTYDDVAWNSGNSGDVTHIVGLKAANELGLYDMSGNVWERVYDWYGTITMGNTEINPTGASTGSYRILRGSALDNPAGSVSNRNGTCAPNTRYRNISFRLARSNK